MRLPVRRPNGCSASLDAPTGVGVQRSRLTGCCGVAAGALAVAGRCARYRLAEGEVEVDEAAAAEVRYQRRARGPVTFRSPRSASTSDGSLGLLATQTLTFLFTDVEGSTALLMRLGDRYAEVLADHHQLIRASLAAHGGEEVDTQGDAFFAVFSSPSACATAAIEMQRAFLSHRWPAGEAVRVRMGVHSGEASQSAVGLVGLGHPPGCTGCGSRPRRADPGLGHNSRPARRLDAGGRVAAGSWLAPA